MSDQINTKKADKMYEMLCDMLQEANMKFRKDPEERTVFFIMQGEDIPMEIIAIVDAEHELIKWMSNLPFHFSEDKIVEGAIVTSFANYKLVDGSFDFDVTDGQVLFRMTASYRDSLLSKQLFAYMLAGTVAMVDRFNDKFLMVNKGVVSVEQFIASC